MIPSSIDESIHDRDLVSRLRRSNELGILLVLTLLILAVGIANPKFWTIASFANFGARAAWFGIIALGVVFLLSMGEIDLSTGSIYGLTINAAAVLMVKASVNPWIAALIGLFMGVGLGALNALLCAILKLPVIIVTLGTLSVFRGLALMINGGGFLYGLPRDHPFFVILGSAPFGLRW